MARPGLTFAWVDSSPRLAVASQPRYRNPQTTAASARPLKPPTPPTTPDRVKFDQDGRVAPPAWVDSWIRARITNEMIEAYSTKMNVSCNQTVGRIPLMASQSRMPMITVATIQVTGLPNVLVGEMTNSRYPPARVMFPTLARVEVRALRKPVP